MINGLVRSPPNYVISAEGSAFAAAVERALYFAVAPTTTNY
jgi:hypothetical protein